MEVLLIHKPRGVMPPEMMAATMEIGKKIVANPGEVVPGGKLISCSRHRYGCLPMGGSKHGGINAYCGTNEYDGLGH